MATRNAKVSTPQSKPESHQAALPSEGFLPELPASNEDQEKLKLTDFDSLNYLTACEIHTRYNLLALLIPVSLRQLMLRPKSVDIAIRLFDYFCLKKIQFKECSFPHQIKSQKVKKIVQGRFLEHKEHSKIILVVCLFLAAKFNEIYAPGLSDFLYLISDNLTKSQELELQKEILLTTGIGLTKSTMSDWYTQISGQKLPEWALMIYCHSLNKAQHLARAVHYVFENEKQKALSTSSAKLSRILGVLGLKKNRQTSNRIKTMIKSKVEANPQACLSKQESQKLEIALHQLKSFLETKNLQKQEGAKQK